MGRRRVGGIGGGLEGAEKRGFQDAFQAELVAEIEAFVGKGAADRLDFEAIEIAVRRQALALAAHAVESRINADTSDHAAAALSCRCGKLACYRGRRTKRFRTALGPITLERAYYWCGACARGFCPRDRNLGLDETSLSPSVTRMVGLTAAMVSFEESSELLRELAGVTVDAKQVERTAEALGAEIAEDETNQVELLEEPASTMYVGLDGTGVPVRRSEVEAREGKQPDGSAKTREVKLCTVWSAEGRDAQGIPIRDEGSVSYSAAIESAASSDRGAISEFARRVERETTRRGFEQVARQVALGDGAPYIWNTVSEVLPDAIQILDRFHAKQHLSEVSKAIYGANGEATAWATTLHDQLDEGKIDDILVALEAHALTSEDARQCVGYVKANRERMRYPEFHAQGLCTSTGVVEAGCRVAIGTRLKRAGMHWTVCGANAIIALRCAKLSGRLEDFWERRSTERPAA